jgi:DNA helicase II / ATP-dependent DNA helicase PcrA
MHSARDISAILELPEPTPEQLAVIEAPPEGAARVIAGAGSGKTETMALRVLWLVANHHVEPDAVLGLTFTRKAAGELSGRIQSRLRALHERGLAPGTDEFHTPSVSTYNSFAARLYRDHAVLLGRDPDARVLSEASAWSLATSVVSRSALPELSRWDTTVPTLVRTVRTLGSRMQENSIASGDMETFVEEFQRLLELPHGGTGAYKTVDEWVERIGSLTVLMALVEEFQEAKRLRGVLEFADQIALALQIVEGFPHVCEQVKARHRVVLLDEYQDTSVAQTTLLRALFSAHPVMAVGDPHQAIYGWRGASSSNLSDFVTDFGQSIATYSLSTSWRNGARILDAATVLASPLSELPGPEVETLKPSPKATQHPLEVVFEETLAEEAAAVASWLAGRLAEAPTPPSAAIIVRARAHQRVFVEALSERGVPVHVLGIGGLLDDPAIADIVCTLRILANTSAETELVRLLVGAKWRLGVADLHALARTVRWLQGRDQHGVALPEEVQVRLRHSVSAHDAPGLFDALSFMAGAPENHSQWQDYSADAPARLRDAYATLSSLSRMRWGDLDALVSAIESRLGLDVEVAANPIRVTSRAAREAFHDALHTYLGVAEESSLAGFVQWLEDAERRDNLTPRAEPPEEGCVQILTIHGAKGLEWDLVVVPRLVADEVPAKPRETAAWLTTGELPYEFRGDKESLPVFPWRAATTRKELMDLQKEFVEDVKKHRGAEERRLIYVAITRARHRVLLSGSFWAHHTTSRAPSIFLQELEDAGLVGALPSHPQSETPPEVTDGQERIWPGDPLGSRRAVVEDAAARVRDAAAGNLGEAVTASGASLIIRLEHARDSAERLEVTIPTRIPASSLERWYRDADAERAALRRPLPQKPYRQALRGTLFHRYVEEHFEEKPFYPLSGIDDDDDVDTLGLEEWVAAFEASPFSGLTPIAIEQELHLPLAGHVVVCKIDAVFPGETGPHIVDWKTGAMPTGPDDIQAKSLQLAAYRAAWAQWTGVAEDTITASFWYAGTSTLVTPEALPLAPQLEETFRALWG